MTFFVSNAVSLFLLCLSYLSYASAIPMPSLQCDIYQDVFRNSPIPIILLTHDLKIKDMSNYFDNFPGRAEWKKQSLYEVLRARLSEDNARKLLKVVQNVQKTSETEITEVDDVSRQHHWSIQINTCVTNHHSAKHVFNKISGRKKKNILITLHCLDVTGLTQHNPIVRNNAASADIYHTMVSNLEGYAVYVINKDGTVRTWNRGAERMKLYTADEIIGRNFDIFYPAELRSTGVPFLELEDAMFDQCRQLEGWRVRKDGSKFWASVYTQPIFVDQEHTGFVKITRDLTDTIARQEAIWEGQNNAAKMKQQFLSTASHEIRSPLTGILSGLDLLIKSDPTSEQKDILESTKTSGNSLLRIVNDILDYSKLEARAMTLHETYTDLHEFTLRRIETFRMRSKVPISLIYQQNVPKRISLDAERYLQVLTNLVDNAIKFTKKGYIKVSINIRRRTPSQHNLDRILLEVAVTDSGIGISADEIDNLFLPYSQVYRRENSGGTGLGLAISKELVELMNGHIWVDSNITGGSTFYFTMECGLAEPKRGDSIPTPIEDMESSQTLPLRLLNLVVVDDNRINRNHLIKLLQKSSYTVQAFDSGAAVVSYFQELSESRLEDEERSSTNHIVLMDIQMPPGINGLEATRQIHGIEGFKEVPVIGLTANALASDQQACFDSGMSDYITKPFSITDLLNRIRRIESHLALSALSI